MTSEDPDEAQRQVIAALVGETLHGQTVRSVHPCHGLRLELQARVRERRTLALRLPSAVEPEPAPSEQELESLAPEGYGWRVYQHALEQSEAQACTWCQGLGRVLCPQCWGSRRHGCEACGGTKFQATEYHRWGPVHSLFGGSRRALVTMAGPSLCACTIGSDCSRCEDGRVRCEACGGDGEVTRQAFERICFYPEKFVQVLGMESVPSALRAREAGTVVFDGPLSDSVELPGLSEAECASVRQFLDQTTALWGDRTTVLARRLRLTRYCFWKIRLGGPERTEEHWLHGPRPRLPRSRPRRLLGKLAAWTAAAPADAPPAVPPPLPAPTGSTLQMVSFEAQRSSTSRPVTPSAEPRSRLLLIIVVFLLGVAVGAVGLWSVLPLIQGDAPGQQPLPLEDPGG